MKNMQTEKEKLNNKLDNAISDLITAKLLLAAIQKTQQYDYVNNPNLANKVDHIANLIVDINDMTYQVTK